MFFSFLDNVEREDPITKWGERGSNYHFKWAIFGPPAKRHLNGISLGGDDGPILNVGLNAGSVGF